MNHTTLSVSLMDKSGFGGYQEKITSSKAQCQQESLVDEGRWAGAGWGGWGAVVPVSGGGEGSGREVRF